jgi:flagellar biosynthesis protein FlhG
MSPADLDHELDAVLADPLARTSRAASDAPLAEGRDDQATRLRALVREREIAPGEGGAGASIEEPLFEPFAGVRPAWRGAWAARSGAEDRATQPVRSHLARLIAVSSGKGGVGKSNIAVNLAVALSQRGLRVVLLDADLGTANADVLCGLMPVARLEHVVTPLPVHDGGRRTLGDIAVAAPGGFRLIPGSAGVARMADLGSEQQRDLLEQMCRLEDDADVIIVDTGAGVGRHVIEFLLVCDDALVVTTSEPTALADAYALIKCLHGARRESAATAGHEHGRVSLVVNQVADGHEARAVHARLDGVCRRFLGESVAFAGSIAQDLRVPEAVRARLPFVLHAPRAEATRDLRRVADALALQVERRAGPAVPAGAARASRLARWLRRAKDRE